MPASKKYPPRTPLPDLSAAGRPFPNEVRVAHANNGGFRLIRGYDHALRDCFSRFILAKRATRKMGVYSNAFERVTKLVTLMADQSDCEVIKKYGYGRPVFQTVAPDVRETLTNMGLSDWVPWSYAETPESVRQVIVSTDRELVELNTVTDAQRLAVIGERLGKRPPTPADFCDMFPEIDDHASRFYYIALR